MAATEVTSLLMEADQPNDSVVKGGLSAWEVSLPAALE
jgi:hypothetical protein